MKKLVFILGITLVLGSCGNKESENQTLKNSTTVESEYNKSEFSNPAFMQGSSFGEFFISMIRTQNYDMALKFTSKESIDKFGVDKIKEKYQNFSFNYKLIQKSVSQVGNSFTLVYTTNEYATGKLKKINIVLENDSCKLVLPENLDNLLK